MKNIANIYKNRTSLWDVPYRPKVLKEWPPGVNYGGDNKYPDVYPYNITHKPPVQRFMAEGGSAAGLCVEEIPQ